MMLPFIYLGIGFAVIFLLIGYLVDDWFFKFISGIMMLIIGINIIRFGIERIINLGTQTMGILFIGIAAYVMIVESYELYREM